LVGQRKQIGAYRRAVSKTVRYNGCDNDLLNLARMDFFALFFCPGTNSRDVLGNRKQETGNKKAKNKHKEKSSEANIRATYK
jgi:hypothetical protein